VAALSGFQILVDRGRCVIVGHGRLAAAKLLKLDRVPIIRIEHLSSGMDALVIGSFLVDK
jgi:ParB-like chromosome segregation protein Spo0J